VAAEQRVVVLERTMEELKRSMTHASDTAQEALVAARSAHTTPTFQKLAEQVTALQQDVPRQRDGGDAEQRACQSQVVVALPHAQTQQLLALAKQAAAAAAKGDVSLVDSARVVYAGEAAAATAAAADAGGASTSAQGAAAGSRRSARQALVLVTFKQVAAAQAAVRQSAALKHESRFEGVYVRQSLTVEQQRLRREYMAHSAELAAARSARQHVMWRDGVPHVMQQDGTHGRRAWRALPQPGGEARG
jgi:hypothetical protein